MSMTACSASTLRSGSGSLVALTPEQTDHYVFGGTMHADGRSLLYTARFRL